MSTNKKVGDLGYCVMAVGGHIFYQVAQLFCSVPPGSYKNSHSSHSLVLVA